MFQISGNTSHFWIYIMRSLELAKFIRDTIHQEVNQSQSITPYRDPIIGFVTVDDPDFADLSELIGFDHLMPNDLLPGARSVVSFFLPFTSDIAYANAKEKVEVAPEWAIAYVETNALIGRITSKLIDVLGQHGIRAAAEPATGNFDDKALKSHWSHKSIAVLAGIGSFGLHQMVITDAGCAGRFGSLVINAELPFNKPGEKERCEFFASGTCLDCVLGCPVNAIVEEESFNRQTCWEQCLKNGEHFLDLGDEVHVCGKCAVVGPCALESGN
jgi:epoxyqueuosine reductase QueG